MQGFTTPHWAVQGGQVALFALVYFVVAKLSLVLAIPPGYATAVWPPSGIALAAVLLLGRRVWPGIWIGAALVNLAVDSSLLAAYMIACGNTFEAIAGAALIRRRISRVRRFERGADVVGFVACAALSSIIAATIAMAALSYQGSVPAQSLFQNWWTWWQGDTAGMIILTPLILSWCDRRQAALSWQKKVEACCCGVLLLIATLASFYSYGWSSLPMRMTFLILPFVIWVALRFSQREVTTATALVSAIAIGCTVQGLGPFALPSLNESLLLLLAFISTLVAMGLVLNAIVGERSRALKDLENAVQDLNEQAITDPLTHLPNQRYLREFLPREVLKAKSDRRSIAVIMIDLDYFKRINDGFGHAAGDLVLREVAAVLKAHVRGRDMACRYGGDEFLLVLPDTTLQGTKSRAESIRRSINRLRFRFGAPAFGSVTASVGAALFPHHAEDADALIRASCEALYIAKTDARDRIAMTRPAMKALLKPMQTKPL